MALPLPDDAAAMAARERLTSIDVGVSAPTAVGLGMLAEAVVFVAGVQGNAYPRPLLSTRVVLLAGSHAGGVVAGPTPDPRNGVPLQHMAINAGAGIVTLEWQPASAAIELEDAITPEQMDAALRAGWAEAERAADEGIELIIVAAGGPGAATAAVAVIAAITGADPPGLLPRVVTPAGRYDDNAWMTRCLALRDALHRVRDRHGDARTVLAALGGADIAAATGLLLGASSRRTPVMIDGPVGAAAALLANDMAPQTRRWVMMPDTARHPAVRLAAGALELRPWLDLCLDLGEGCSSLTALPLLQNALTLAGVGEPVDDVSLTRYDSSGNQVFVGVAKPVEPPPVEEPEVAAAEAKTPVKAAKAETPAKADAPAKAEAPARAAKADASKAAAAKSAEPAKTAMAAAMAAAKAEAKAEAAKAEAKAEAAKATSAAAKATEPAAKAGKAAEPAAKAAKAGPPPPSKVGASRAPDLTEDHTVPIKIARPPAKAVPAKATPPAKDAAAKDAAAKGAAGKDTQAKDTQAKDTAGRDGPKDAPPKDPAAAKDGPPSAAGKEPSGKESTAKDGSAREVTDSDRARTAPAPRPATKDAAAKDSAAKEPAKDSTAKETAAKDTVAAGKASPGPATTTDSNPNGGRSADTVTAGSSPAQAGPPRPRKRP